MTSSRDIDHLEFNNSNVTSVGGDLNNFNITYANNNPTTSGSTSPGPSLPIIDFPSHLLSPQFTGREHELTRLTRTLRAVVHDNLPIRCIIHGMPAIGKTQLILRFLTLVCRQFQMVLWISGSTIESVAQGYSRLLTSLNHADRSQHDQSAKLTAARLWLEKTTSVDWVIVFDNVEPKTLDFLREHLPRRNSRGRILFTTRTEGVATALARVGGRLHDSFELHALGIPDASKLLLKYVERSLVTPQAADDLVQCIGCLPFAITQAGSYMTKYGLSLTALHDLYQGQHKMKVIEWENPTSEYEKKSVAAAFLPQLQDLEVRLPLASELLKILSFFNVEKIQVDMLVDGAQYMSNPRSTSLLTAPETSNSITRVRKAFASRFSRKTTHDVGMRPYLSSLLHLIQSPADLREALSLLQDLSLIQYRSEQQSPHLSLHELIRLMVQEKLRKTGNEKELLQVAIQCCCAAFDRVGAVRVGDLTSRTNWLDCEAFIPHVQSLTTQAETLGVNDLSLLLANERVAQHFHSNGRYADAQSLLVRSAHNCEELLGRKHRHTLRLMESLARACGSLGRHDEAESLLRRVLEIRETRQPGHVDSLITLNNLGDRHLARGTYKEAEIVFRLVLAAWEQRVGVTHEKTRMAMNSLAIALHYQAKNSEAEELYREVLAIERAELGEEHFDTLGSMNNLANLHLWQKRFAEAEEMQRKVLRAREKHQGAGHPKTLLAVIGLGYAVQSQRRYEEAETLYQQVLEAGSGRLRPKHPYILQAMRELFKLYQIQGRVDDARLMDHQIALVSSSCDGD